MKNNLEPDFAPVVDANDIKLKMADNVVTFSNGGKQASASSLGLSDS